MKHAALLLVLTFGLFAFGAHADPGGAYESDPALYSALMTHVEDHQAGGRGLQLLISVVNSLNAKPLGAAPMLFVKEARDGGQTLHFKGHQEGTLFDPAPICQDYVLDTEGTVSGPSSPKPSYRVDSVEVRFTDRQQCV